MEREAENTDDEIVGVGGEALQFFGAEHGLEGAEQCGKFDGQLDVVEQPAEILESVGDALQEMNFTFVEAAKTVGPEGLHDANVDVSVVIAEKNFAIELDVVFEGVEIVIEELRANSRGKIGFGVIEERGDVILQSAFAAALIVDKIRLAVFEHDVAGLEIAVKEIVAVGAQKKIGEFAEIVFKRLLMKRNAGEAEKVIFEIVEVPGDGLAVEAADGIADGIVQILGGFNLKARKDFENFFVGVDGFRRECVSGAILVEKFKERGVTEVFFNVGAPVEIGGVNFRDGQAVGVEVAREGEEGCVFFADVVEDADGGLRAAMETNDFAAGAAEFALERDDTIHGSVEVGFKERFENVDQSFGSISILYDLSCPLFFSTDVGNVWDLVGGCC